MNAAAWAWLIWFVASLGSFAALETHALSTIDPHDTLSGEMKRLLAKRRDAIKAAFLIIWCGGFVLLGVHFLGWLW